jgi:hypothetical protein
MRDWRLSSARSGVGLSLRAGLWAVALGCAGCPSLTESPLLVRINALPYLGEQRVDILARGFAGKGRSDPPNFGYYVYLVIAPRATRAQRELAASAFMDHPAAADLSGDPKTMALLLAPVQILPSPSPCVGPPQSAAQLLSCYDTARATLITEAVEKVHDRLPAVALVAYPKPIEAGTSVDPKLVFVTDACGSEDDVKAKFDKVRAAAQGNPDGQLRRFIESLGTLFLTGRTKACP